jgi:hypothetical protein
VGAAAGRHMQVDEGVAPGGVLAGQEDRVRVTDHAEVEQRLVFIGTGNHEIPLGVIGGDRRGGQGRVANRKFLRV